MTRADARTEVRALVRELLARRGITDERGDDTPLLSSGLIDSTDVLEIVVLLEERFGVDFSVRDFDPESFDSVDRIVAMLG